MRATHLDDRHVPGAARAREKGVAVWLMDRVNVECSSLQHKASLSQAAGLNCAEDLGGCVRLVRPRLAPSAFILSVHALAVLQQRACHGLLKPNAARLSEERLSRCEARALRGGGPTATVRRRPERCRARGAVVVSGVDELVQQGFAPQLELHLRSGHREGALDLANVVVSDKV